MAYASGTDSVVAVGNYLLVGETKSRPALTVGTGIERVGGGDPAGFLLASKGFPSKRHPLSTYVGLAVREPHSSEEHEEMGGGDDLEVVAVGGVTAQAMRNLNASLMWDGSELHFGLQSRYKSVSIAALAVGMEDFGFVVGRSWQIKRPEQPKRERGEPKSQ